MPDVRWLVLLPLAAYWSVWSDFALRVWRDPELGAHPLSAMVGVWLLWSETREAPRVARLENKLAFGMALVCAAVFALLYARLSWMARYALALHGLGASLWWLRAPRRPWLALGFLMLAVPMLTQLEQLLGPSVRLSVAEAAAMLVRVCDESVVARGTRLEWLGGAVDVDAPCSGLRMLWTGAFVLLVALAHFRLSISRALVLTSLAPALIWLGNVLRCSALFYVESGLLRAPRWVHPGVGLVVFASVCITLWEAARWLADRARQTASDPCVR